MALHLATFSARIFIYYVMLYGVCGYALVRGRTDARIVSVVFFVGNYVSAALQSPLAISYRSVETGISPSMWSAFFFLPTSP